MPESKKRPKKQKRPTYPELFRPIEIGGVEIKNRIVMAPMNTLFSMNNLGYVNEQILAYYAARAKGGVGLIISECILGTRLASRFPYTTNLHLFNGTHVPGLEEVVETTHAFGAKVFIQLSSLDRSVASRSAQPSKPNIRIRFLPSESAGMFLIIFTIFSLSAVHP